MSYRAPVKTKDLKGAAPHKVITRRDLLSRGLATGVLSVAVPRLVFGDFVKTAYGATTAPNCTAGGAGMLPDGAFKGAIAQIYASGGPTMGARFISDAQANGAATMFSNYGITGSSLRRLGPNVHVDANSAFGATLLAGPAGYPGGSAAWQSEVLSKVSAGAHMGQFKDDDGGADALGLLGCVSPYKKSLLGKDLKLTTNHTAAAWTAGAPAATFNGGYSPSSFANLFGLTPRAPGFTNSNAMVAAGSAAGALADVFSGLFGTKARKGATKMAGDAGAAFYGNACLADPNYGTNLFTPSLITPLAGLTGLTDQEKAQLAAFYRSATGEAGGVVIQFEGRDYHPGATVNDVAAGDVEDARAFVMFLAGCHAAAADGSLIYLANGNANASGVTSMDGSADPANPNNTKNRILVNGVATTLNVPTAVGDSGGTYNAGLIMFYKHSGTPPAARFSGTIALSDGQVTADSSISIDDAVAGLYLSAFKFVSGNVGIPQSLIDAMKAAGINQNLDKIMVFS